MDYAFRSLVAALPHGKTFIRSNYRMHNPGYHLPTYGIQGPLALNMSTICAAFSASSRHGDYVRLLKVGVT